MDTEEIKIVHALPGRIRLKVAQVREDPTFASQLQQKLGAIQGVYKVEANPLTGSVLILYDAAVTTSSDSLRALAEPLSHLFPGFEEKNLEPLLSASANGTNAPPPLADSIRTFFASLNTRVNSVTGGSADLRILLPLALFLLGIRGLLSSEKRGVPTWYDLLWFALGTYFMLNPNPDERQP